MIAALNLDEKKNFVHPLSLGLVSWAQMETLCQLGIVLLDQRMWYSVACVFPLLS
jgi:hypothetical protein